VNVVSSAFALLRHSKALGGVRPVHSGINPFVQGDRLGLGGMFRAFAKMGVTPGKNFSLDLEYSSAKLFG
jgi:hypothetical protein